MHEMAVERNWADGYRGWSTVGTDRLDVEEREQAQVQAQVTLQAWVKYAPEDGSGSGMSEATGTGWTQDQEQWGGGLAHAVGWVPVW